MPMATDLRRRRLLERLALFGVAGGACSGRVSAQLAARTRLVAAWQDAGRLYVGVLGEHGGPDADAGLHILSRLEVPTRAHGLTPLPDGRILAVARRPGDWLLRWRPGTAEAEWHWARSGTVFNGHAVLVPDGTGHAQVLVTQTKLDDGAGQIGVLDGRTLARLDAWPTRGTDPHDLLWHRGRLWVANGGITTHPETGRVKHRLERMDSSLVALHPRTGAVLGQWRLPDPRLSLRHLASQGRLIGVALQAEHSDAALRAAAPLLAVFDPHGSLQMPALPEGMITGGYGGDIAALADGFVVSATRADRVLAWSAARGWQSAWPLTRPCALADAPSGLWSGSATGAWRIDGRSHAAAALRFEPLLDNHWALLA
jgi:uncharacterized protein